MPSFFESLGRVISGEPVFDPEDNSNQPKAGESTMQDSDKIKKAHIIEVKCYDEGSNMVCWITIHNESDGQLELNQFEFLGSSTDLQTFLKANEQREFKAYEGPHLAKGSNNQCKLEYIDSNSGRYLVADHYVYFREDPNGKNEIDRIELNQISFKS